MLSKNDEALSDYLNVLFLKDYNTKLKLKNQKYLKSFLINSRFKKLIL